MARQPAAASVSVVSAIDANRTAADKLINTYLLDGASEDMGVDGSSTPVIFKYTVPAAQSAEISRIILYMEASGGGFDSELFMNITALSNGVQINCNGVEIENWKDNIDIVTTMFDLSSAGAAFGKATNTLTGRWTLTKDTDGLSLWIDEGATFEAVVRDDLSAAGIIFRIKMKGKLVQVED